MTIQEQCSGPCQADCTSGGFIAKCGSASKNLCTDAANCGSCGKACSSGEVCCLGTCVNLKSGSILSGNVVNCGACSRGDGIGVCPYGASCSGGVCACPSDQINSNGVCCPQGLTNCDGLTCTDTSSDTNNCGACGNVCPGGYSCTNGACISPCDSCTKCEVYWGPLAPFVPVIGLFALQCKCNDVICGYFLPGTKYCSPLTGDTSCCWGLGGSGCSPPPA